MIRPVPQESEFSLTASDGFAARAAKATQAEAVLPDPLENSRADFLQAIELLGAGRRLQSSLLNEKTRLTARVHINCKQQTWHEIFGEPQCVEQYHFQASRPPIYLWKYSCQDGPVTCVGHVYERSPGETWLVIVRVGLL